MAEFYGFLNEVRTTLLTEMDPPSRLREFFSPEGGACVLGRVMVTWYVDRKETLMGRLGGGFKHFLFSSLLGEDSHFY